MSRPRFAWVRSRATRNNALKRKRLTGKDSPILAVQDKFPGAYCRRCSSPENFGKFEVVHHLRIGIGTTARKAWESALTFAFALSLEGK